MFEFRIKQAAVALTLASLLLSLSACGDKGVVRSSPLSSQRGVETLEFEPGETPQWRKNGNIKVKAEGEREEEDLLMRITLSGKNKSRTIEADGREVVVSGDGGNLIINGGCSKLSVTGKNLELKCDYVNEINVSGSKNRIVCDSLRSGLVTGDENTIGWKQATDDAIPEINFKGINNSLEHIVPRYKRKL